MNSTIRVFNKRTSFTPDDPYVFIGHAPFPQMLPEHDAIEVSCVFSWDRAECENLRDEWEMITGEKVRLGGVAFGSEVGEFTPGKYVKKGVTFTTRGCNNNCPWCIVPKLEGGLREIEIKPGRIIQDNNFLQASRAHKEKVFEMLKHQHGIEFRGGLEPDLIDDHFVENVRGLRIKRFYLACDTDARLPAFQKGCAKLVKAGFKREQIQCYALSYGKDMEKDEARCRAIWEAGAMPFVQLYKDPEREIEYSREWKQFQRRWARPQIIKARMKSNGVDNEQ